MYVQSFQVDPRLTAYIESIWTFETEIGLPADDLCTTIVPSARPKLVIPYRGRMFSVINNRGIEHPQASMILVGMMERSVVIDSSAIGVLALEFKPGTLYRFLGFPLKEVTNTAYPLEVVLGQLGQGLQQRLQAAPDPTGKARLTQDFLLRQQAGVFTFDVHSTCSFPGDALPNPSVAEASHDQSQSSGPAMSHLGMLFHYPKPEYRETVLRGFLSIAKIMNAQSGVEASTYEEGETGALVAVTKYDSLEAIQAGFRAVAATGIDPKPNSDRESRPRDLHCMVLIQRRE